MFGGKLTPREAEIIHQLLFERGISKYEIVDVVNEGKDLPGCTYDNEIELLSATVVIATNIYTFWLDWRENTYTFWHWRELALDKIRPGALAYKNAILAAQRRLRQNSTNAF
ncbi:MAG: hypothetical protein ACYDER_16815 [Ktedonobacteraceae bacterium]